MEFTARFHGKKKGAIGLGHWFVVSVSAESQEAARLKLYDNYEHISSPTITAEEKGDGTDGSNY